MAARPRRGRPRTGAGQSVTGRGPDSPTWGCLAFILLTAHLYFAIRILHAMFDQANFLRREFECGINDSVHLRFQANDLRR